MKLLTIVGSNASVSYNRLLLKYLQRHFADQADFELQEIRDLPLFNEDLLQAFPQDIKKLITKVETADGLIIATPEYDHSMTAALKSVLEWLSASYHTLRGKPVMIVGASYGAQGTVRAQMDLRHVLDSPGVDAYVLPGNEFMLPNCKTAFDSNQNLKEQKTIEFLEKCFHNFVKYVQLVNSTKEEAKTMPVAKNIRWDATYDVIVLGFGGAGATAARFAADAGANVLLVDSAPEGHEGGNTRYAGQLVGAGDDFDALKRYYQNLTAPFALDEELVNTYVEGMVNMRAYFRKYLGVEPFSVAHDWDHNKLDLSEMVHEFPEYPGNQAYDMLLVHDGMLDSALWKNLRQQVIARADRITVWFSSPGKHLIQAEKTKTVLGVQIERDHVLVNIQAKNGVVMAVGGFENNQQMVQDYLGAPRLTPLGSMYNKGDGIKMGLEAGADLWHMHNYESLGIYHGMCVSVPKGERGQLLLAPWKELFTGSIFVIGDDGTRYFNEAEANRHGHIYDHGTWRVPAANAHPYAIFDQSQLEIFKKMKKLPVANFYEMIIKGDSLAELAKLIKVDAAKLKQTRADFDHLVTIGYDFANHREIKTMQPFGEGPYYALPLTQTMLNTQGGPRHNSRCEVLDPWGKPVPHLYAAGELGGINTNQYQGGNNLAECLIFGKIAGENAARPKEISRSTPATKEDEVSLTNSSVSSLEDVSDVTQQEEHYVVGAHQYLGKSDAGMGNEVVVRVTYDAGKIEEIEILKQSESGDVGAKALQELPRTMIRENSYAVDSLSGASLSSSALKAAVKQAIDKAKKAEHTQIKTH